MRNLSKLVFQRVVIVGICLLIEIGIFAMFFVRFMEYLGWYEVGIHTLSLFLALFIVNRDIDPAYKIAWILPILAFPAFGIAIWLLFGNAHAPKREKRKLQRMDKFITDNLSQDQTIIDRLELENSPAARQAHYLSTSGHFPIYTDTATSYFSSGESCYAEMLKDLKKAERYIFLEYFIIQPGKMWDSILAVIQEKADSGVDVRVLYDDFGCIRTLPANYCSQLEARGIRCRRFGWFIPICTPRLNNRDHRKLLCIDGRIAYTGGINLADEYINERRRYGHWKDCGLRVEGNAARSMTVMFLSLWRTLDSRPDPAPVLLPEGKTAVSDGYVQPYSDCPLEKEGVGESVFLNMISRARRSVYISTPYLVLDSPMRSVLCTAAKAGVDIRIITPGIPDKKYVYAVTRANYRELLDAGVHIYEYTPGFIHAKTIVVDGNSAVVGTVNMDFRSLYLHYENGVFLYHTDSVAQVSKDLTDTFPLCREVSPEEYRRRPLYIRLLEAQLRVFAPLM